MIVRRLPNGSFTKTYEEYFKAWNEIAEKVLEYFPKYELFGYDPGLTFHKYEKNRFDVDKISDTLNLSVASCLTLIASAKPNSKIKDQDDNDLCSLCNHACDMHDQDGCITSKCNCELTHPIGGERPSPIG